MELYLDYVRKAGIVTDHSLNLGQRTDNCIVLVPE